jgi:target of rapamycin complex 2 subunit MAPKAP1
LNRPLTELANSFAIWYLRTSYLANIKDGIGERLINVNSSVLNTPGFRAAGWSANPADIKRTYSPPIPTAITSEYFQAPNGAGTQRVASFGDEEEEGGMVTGGTTNGTIAPGPTTAKRRRRREHVEDDDSSDLSDESEDETEGAQRAAQQIRFAKMPVRQRSDSSPIRSSARKDGPELLVTSPSRRSTDSRLRRGSLGAVEAVKARARRDTTTSSEMSSENELDPSYFQRRQISSRSTPKGTVSGEKHPENGDASRPRKTGPDAESDADSVGSAVSSDLGETMDSASLLDMVDVPGLEVSSTSLVLTGMTSSSPSTRTSPKKTRSASLLHDLPPPRPISVVEPVSLLGSALRARLAKPRNPIEPFANLSGKGSPNPLWIKIYAPFSTAPETPYEMPLARTSKDGASVIVAEAIGLALWRYMEEGRKPVLEPPKLNVNKWTMRMVEDGEVEYDFPALGRTRPMSEFTANNNRGARGRSRERPFDEFALVEATPQQAEDNHKATPKFTPTAESEARDSAAPEPAVVPRILSSKPQGTRHNPILGGQPFASALNNTSMTPADMPAAPTSHATPRMGVTRTLRIRYLDLDVSTQVTTMEISADSYIAEILDHVCKRWNLDKAGFTLKVSGTNTVAPLDRTVEALGARSDLDLVRRRFGAGPLGLTGSPGSSSPNAPLLVDIEGPKKGKKGLQMFHPLAQKQDLMSSASNYKKYTVIRKQLTSFRQDNQRVLAFDGDFLHIMPGEHSSAKTTSVAFADVLRCKVSSKHAKIIRLVVRRPNESKQYDFEARSADEAQEIVDEVRKEMKLGRDMMA